MPLKHTDRNLLSIPMGISVTIHILLVISLTSFLWKNTVSKPETPPIKINYISLESKKTQKKITPRKRTAKPAKGIPRPLKTSNPLKAPKPFQPVQQHASTASILTPIPVKAVSPTANNIGLQIQSATMISISTPPAPVTVKTRKEIPLIDVSSIQSTPAHNIQRSLSTVAHSTKPIQPSIGGSEKSSFRVATKVLMHSRPSISTPSQRTGTSLRTISKELHLSIKKASPVPRLNTFERWIPRSNSHPVQVASIPSEFFDENSKSTSQATISNPPGHPEGATDSSGQDLNAIRKGYSSIVWGKIVKAKYYPSKARKRGWEGNPVVEFKLARNGDLLSSTLAHTSPHKILDEAALNAVKNAVPYPQIPDKLKVDSIRFKLPISFILDEP